MASPYLHKKWSTTCCGSRRSFSGTRPLFLYAPPGSGYASLDDETSALPDTYEPMMEYPGAMRPGRTPENVPFHDLPIGDDDPDPIPWPHFQEIEWHHQWDPPHEHPIPMEEFIEMQGRWATPEMEAAMRSGVRQNVRERRELAEAEKRDTIITDDIDDEYDADVPVELGDGIYGRLGSAADQALTAAATAPVKKGQEQDTAVENEDDEDDLDDFLLDLGLDLDLDDDDDDEDGGNQADQNKASKKSLVVSQDEEDIDDDDDDLDYESDETVDATTTITVDDDDDADLDLEDDDEVGDGVDTVPLEDFGENENLDTEDIFGEGGFDFDDGDYDMDGGDMW